MVETYRKNIKITLKGETYNLNGLLVLIDTEKESTETMSGTIGWKDFDEFYYIYGLECPFTCYNTKKGKRICYFDSFSKDIKQWKEELNITYVREYEKVDASINEILNYSDSEKAIQYLVERGIKNFPLTK